MRVTPILSTVLAASPSLVAAAGHLGFSLGAKQPDGDCKVRSDYEADFDAIIDASGSKIVRIYAADQCNTAKEILPAAKAKDFKVVLGIWADTQESYDADKAAIVRYSPGFEDQVYAVTVGSESMYRGTYTGEDLLKFIRDMKQATPHFKIGTADTWNKFSDGTSDAFLKEVDIVLCNAFSYWQGHAIGEATTGFFHDAQQAFAYIQEFTGSLEKPELWIGETGWPSEGDKYGDAVPGLEAAGDYFQNAVCGMVDWGFNVFFFEAFDEPWKPVSIGEDGTAADERHWGGMEEDRKAKYSLKC